jgi:hypothetical protein
MTSHRRVLALLVGWGLLVGCGAGCAAKSLDARMANGEKRATDAEADVEYYPDRSLIRERMDRLEALLPEVRQERTKRDRAEKVAKQRAELEKARVAYEQAYEVVEK